MAFATPRRVHFNREVSKWSAGRATPSIQRLSNNALPENSTTGATSFNNNDSMNDNDSIISTNESNMKSNSRNVPASKPNDQSSLITVAIRVRPLNGKELAAGCTNSIHVSQDQKEITLRDKLNKHFKFTCDFAITGQQAGNYASPLSDNSSLTCEDIKADSQQQFLYESIGKPLLNKAYEGYNASIFAYGQTGSGKTYSMIGTDKQPGLIPRLVDDLFERKKQRDLVVSSTHIEISYYEIYNEKIYDLLRSSSDPSTHGAGPASTSNKHLQIRENPVTGPYIVDLLAVSVQAAADAKTWFDIGNKRRATACTNMNQKSSRSHSVFQIILTQMLEHSTNSKQQNEEGAENSLLQLVTSKIYLVDLAGSERINTSIANLNSNDAKNSSGGGGCGLATPSSNAAATSSRFKESTCINKSLLTLGKIICLLSDRQQSSSSSSSNPAPGYLPYRESTLTWLLKESLGGNAKTAMLATVNASSSYFDETLCTLRYAAKTACIKNAAHLNRNFRQKYTNEFGEQMETNLVIPPMSTFDLTGMNGQGKGAQYNSLTRKHAQSAELEMTLKLMEQEWKEKLEEAERLKQKEINDLERSLIVLYENETRVQNCCLINLNEDPLLSEKLIYQLKSTNTGAGGGGGGSNRTSVGDASEIVTLVGSDKNQVNIHLTGPLIAPRHCRIWTNVTKERTQPADSFFIEQVDLNYVTYLNGEVINSQRQLSHGDRIIFGGSHFFRFNNPLANKLASNKSGNNACSTPATQTADANQFKDYQFAKNEIERKQNELMQEKLNEALKKCQQDGDARLQELKQKYERNIETIKNDLEREKSARKQDIEQITTESNKKLKQIVHQKILIETRLTEIEHDMVAANQEIDKHERDLAEDVENTADPTSIRTPSIANRRILSKLTEFCSEKKSSAFKSVCGQQEIIQSHANSNGLFGITLKVTEANKICNSIGFEFEFKRHEIMSSGGNREAPNVSTISLASLRKPNSIQMICVIDKRLNLATLWNLDTFDHKLSLLRDIYNRFIEEGSLPHSSSSSETAFITDSTDEWQALDTLAREDETFSPRILENALNRNKQCKRRLSLLGSTASTSCNSSINMPKHGDGVDQCDSAFKNESASTKRKCLAQIQPSLSSAPSQSQSTLGKPFDFTMSLSALNLHQAQTENDQEAQMQMCHSYVFATCRDALNDDDFQSEDEDEDDFAETQNELEIDSLKFPDDSISTVEEPSVKCVARIVYNIEKLMSHFYHDSTCSKKRTQSQRRESTILGENEDDHEDAVSSIGGDISSNDQPLYCMKITMLCSQLSLFKPNSWCLNGENGIKIRHKWSQVSKKIKQVKDTVVDFFQGIGNNVEPMIRSRHESLAGQLNDLMFMLGEYVFLSCSNSLLNRDNYILNAVSSKYLLQYAKGVDKQFEFYLNHKAAKFFDSQIPPIVCFIEKMQMFRTNYQRSKFQETSHPSDMIIDYCNYALQSHFRLTNSFKLLQQQIFFKKNNTEKIAKLFYNILTDSLTLDTISSEEEIGKDEKRDGNETKSEQKLSTTYSNESFILSFRELKKYMHEQDLKLNFEARN